MMNTATTPPTSQIQKPLVVPHKKLCLHPQPTPQWQTNPPTSKPTAGVISLPRPFLILLSVLSLNIETILIKVCHASPCPTPPKPLTKAHQCFLQAPLTLLLYTVYVGFYDCPTFADIGL